MWIPIKISSASTPLPPISTSTIKATNSTPTTTASTILTPISTTTRVTTASIVVQGKIDTDYQTMVHLNHDIIIPI